MARQRARQSRKSGRERASDRPSWVERRNDVPEHLYLLYCVRDSPDGHEQASLLGVYSTRAKALHTKKRLQPATRLAPRTRLQVGTAESNKDYWSEGYVTESAGGGAGPRRKPRVKSARMESK